MAESDTQTHHSYYSPTVQSWVERVNASAQQTGQRVGQSVQAAQEIAQEQAYVFVVQADKGMQTKAAEWGVGAVIGVFVGEAAMRLTGQEQEKPKVQEVITKVVAGFAGGALASVVHDKMTQGIRVLKTQLDNQEPKTAMTV